METFWEFLFSTGRSSSGEKALHRLLQSYPDLEYSRKTTNDGGEKIFLSLDLEWRWIRSAMHAPRASPLWGLSTLTSLSLKNCPFRLDGIRKLTALKFLALKKMDLNPEEIMFPSSLENLELRNCHNVYICTRVLPHAEGHNNRNIYERLEELPHLKSLDIEYAGHLAPSRNDHSGLKHLNKLKRLRLAGISPAIIVELFSEPWNLTSRMNEIELSNCNLHQVYSKILPNLPPSLVTLNLDHNNIRDLEPFLLEGGPPRGMKMLRLAGNPIGLYYEQKHHLYDISDACPQLGCVFIQSGFPHWRNRTLTRLLYKLQLNQFGRGQLGEREDPFPQSLWPIVLGRAANGDLFAGETEHVRACCALLGLEPSLDTIPRSNEVLQRLASQVRDSVLFALLRDHTSWVNPA